MSHFRKLKQKVAEQSALIFGSKPSERRKNSQKRQFIDSIIRGQEATKDREVAAVIVTYTIARIREYYKELKKDPSLEVSDFYRILFDNED